jgi:hypothetical protein
MYQLGRDNLVMKGFLCGSVTPTFASGVSAIRRCNNTYNTIPESVSCLALVWYCFERDVSHSSCLKDRSLLDASTLYCKELGFC